MDEDFENIEIDEKKYSDLVAKLKAVLSEEVKDVRLTSRLQNYPACIVYDRNDPEYQTYNLMRQLGQNAPEPKPILEINPSHPLYAKAMLSDDSSYIKALALVLYNEARILEGMDVTKPVEFAQALNELLSGSKK